MEEQCVIGIDCGTTNVKVVAYDAKGNEIARNSVSNEVINNGVCNEQDMEKLWLNTKNCIKALLDDNPFLKKSVTAIGCSAQGEGIWALGKDGKPVRNAILWNDGRSVDIIGRLKKDTAFYVSMKKQIASYIKNGSTLTLLMWYKENEKENYEKSAYFFTCKDWIRYKLTGIIAWEYTDASCSCIDIEKKEYALDLFEILGLGDIKPKLPHLISATENAGCLKKELAEEFGLAGEIPVSGGMLDIVSSAAGLGMTRQNDTCVILGTTGMTLTIKDAYVADDVFNGWEISMDGSKYVKGMGAMAATPNLDWAIDRLFPDVARKTVFELIEEKLSERLPGSNGLLYHPHISIAGERAPFFESNATAQIFGIRTDTTSLDILQAVMEGVALSIKDCLSDVKDIPVLYATGGGANSNVWMQMLANAVGTTVIVEESKELAAKGAALSAAIMIGIVSDIADKSFFRIKQEYHPQPNAVSAFKDMYEMYKATQKAMLPFWSWRNVHVNQFRKG